LVDDSCVFGAPNGDVTTFYQFTGSRYPSSPLIQGSDGSFYGAAGGLSSGGSFVYKLSTGGVLKVLHQFIPGKKQFGIDTAGVVQGPNGNLYGLTNTDGTATEGTVYEVSTDGSTFDAIRAGLCRPHRARVSTFRCELGREFPRHN
jgi:hypothetical protein